MPNLPGLTSSLASWGRPPHLEGLFLDVSMRCWKACGQLQACSRGWRQPEHRLKRELGPRLVPVGQGMLPLAQEPRQVSGTGISSGWQWRPQPLHCLAQRLVSAVWRRTQRWAGGDRSWGDRSWPRGLGSWSKVKVWPPNRILKAEDINWVSPSQGQVWDLIYLR